MQLAFLLYVPRSGSTFLARTISESMLDVIVLPEFRFPEWLLSQNDRKVRAMSPSELFSLLQLDHQRSNLGLTDGEYRDICDRVAGENKKSMLEAIATAYAAKHVQRTDLRWAIIKLGALIDLLPSIAKEFPGAEFIHVTRDPRAVVNSQISTTRPYFPSEKMGRGDPWHGAKSWRDYQRKIVEARAHGIRIIDIKYERLIVDPAKELAPLCKQLNVHWTEDGMPTGLPLKIRGPEQAIHKKVFEQPDATRNTAFIKELAFADGVVIEFVLGATLSEAGYQSEFVSKCSAWRIAALIIPYAYLRHWHKCAIYYFRRVGYYALEPKRLIGRINILLKRRRESWRRSIGEEQ